MFKPHQIEELAIHIAEGIEGYPLSTVKNSIKDYLENNETDNYELKPDDPIYTHGGEAWVDDLKFDDYGICIGDVSIYNIKPNQMIHLAQVIVDHLLINRHRFEIQKTGEQDQMERLVCLDVQ